MLSIGDDPSSSSRLDTVGGLDALTLDSNDGRVALTVADHVSGAQRVYALS